jgi:hypothetical protein
MAYLSLPNSSERTDKVDLNALSCSKILFVITHLQKHVHLRLPVIIVCDKLRLTARPSSQKCRAQLQSGAHDLTMAKKQQSVVWAGTKERIGMIVIAGKTTFW